MKLLTIFSKLTYMNIFLNLLAFNTNLYLSNNRINLSYRKSFFKIDIGKELKVSASFKGFTITTIPSISYRKTLPFKLNQYNHLSFSTLLSLSEEHRNIRNTLMYKISIPKNSFYIKVICIFNTYDLKKIKFKSGIKKFNIGLTLPLNNPISANFSYKNIYISFSKEITLGFRIRF